jgi:hypothetical protein
MEKTVSPSPSPANPNLYLLRLIYSNSTKIIIRITVLSKQALLEIVQDMEVLVCRFPSFLYSTYLYCD